MAAQLASTQLVSVRIRLVARVNKMGKHSLIKDTTNKHGINKTGSGRMYVGQHREEVKGSCLGVFILIFIFSMLIVKVIT